MSRPRAAEHNCVCLSWQWSNGRCTCGVYSDEHGDWCANENCRGFLGAPSLRCQKCERPMRDSESQWGWCPSCADSDEWRAAMDAAIAGFRGAANG